MPITIDWYDVEKTILRYEFTGQWSWEELHQAMDEVQEQMASVSTRVDVIIDVSQSKRIPAGALSQMRGGTLKASENWGMGVFVGTGTFLNALLTTFSRVYPKMGQRYQSASTTAEAYQLILKNRKL